MGVSVPVVKEEDDVYNVLEEDDFLSRGSNLLNNIHTDRASN